MARSEESTLEDQEDGFLFTETWSNKGAGSDLSEGSLGHLFRYFWYIHWEKPIISLGLGLRGHILAGNIDSSVD